MCEGGVGANTLAADSCNLPNRPLADAEYHQWIGERISLEAGQSEPDMDRCLMRLALAGASGGHEIKISSLCWGVR